jgi:hypothetical protein
MEIGHFEKADGDGDDNFCFPASPVTGPLVAGCFDLDDDFDGYPYQHDWPNGTTNAATSIMIGSPSGHGVGPLSAAPNRSSYVNSYSLFQFETGVAASDASCVSPATCNVPPKDAAFYPYYSFQIPGGAHAQCFLLFGDHISSWLPGINSFGADFQYGGLDTDGDFPEHVSALHLNPCLDQTR